MGIRSLRLAWSLLLVPRLFISLFFFPLILSCLMVYIQLLATGVVLKSTESQPEAVAKTMTNIKHSDFARKIIFGWDVKQVPKIIVCKWEPLDLSNPSSREGPTTEECRKDLSAYDPAILVQDPKTFDSKEYAKVFDGVAFKIHICKKTCGERSHVVLAVDQKGSTETTVRSVFGWLIMHLTRYNDEVQSSFLKAASGFQNIRDMLGTVYFTPYGFVRPTKITGLKESLAVMINIASLVVISLWLALKAHRRVLDYFARSGALLPLVAATGNGAFYGAIWILTFTRVAAFLLASVPMTIAFFTEFLDVSKDEFFGRGPVVVGFWILSLIVGLCLATLIASIADLKHRHGILSFIYRYIPLIICFLGAALWCVTFIADGSVASTIRNVIASLPFVGLTPMLLVPVLEPNPYVLTAQIILSFGTLVFVLKHNARWFAAHLEEL